MKMGTEKNRFLMVSLLVMYLSYGCPHPTVRAWVRGSRGAASFLLTLVVYHPINDDRQEPAAVDIGIVPGHPRFMHRARRKPREPDGGGSTAGRLSPSVQLLSSGSAGYAASTGDAAESMKR